MFLLRRNLFFEFVLILIIFFRFDLVSFKESCCFNYLWEETHVPYFISVYYSLISTTKALWRAYACCAPHQIGIGVSNMGSRPDFVQSFVLYEILNRYQSSMAYCSWIASCAFVFSSRLPLSYLKKIVSDLNLQYFGFDGLLIELNCWSVFCCGLFSRI